MRRIAARRAIFALLAAWIALVLVLTLGPTGHPRPLTLARFLCVGCGSGGTSDIILNWMLFVPGGALACVLLDVRRSLLLAVCLTASVELLQLFIPGRDPALQDLLFNTLGAGSGALLVSRGLGSKGQGAVAVAATLAWLAPLVLSVQAPPPPELYSLWTPELGRHEVYGGEVLGATVGDVQVPAGVVADQDGLDRAIASRARIDLLIVAGPPPPSLAPVLQIGSPRFEAVAGVGIVGNDLEYKGRDLGSLLRLRPRAIRWRGAMEGVAPQDTVRVIVDREGESVCMSVDARTECGLEPSLGDGWGYLLRSEDMRQARRALLNLLWSVGLGFLVGVTGATFRRASLAALLITALSMVGAMMTAEVQLVAHHALVMALGIALGAVLRWPAIAFASSSRSVRLGP